VLSVIQWSEEELQSCGADRQAELELDLAQGFHHDEPSSNTDWRLVSSSSQKRKRKRILAQDRLVYTPTHT